MRNCTSKNRIELGGVATLGLGPRAGRREESAGLGARPGTTNPIIGVNHPARKKRRRSLPTWRRGFVRAGAEPIEEAGFGGPVSRLPSRNPGISAGGAAFRGGGGLERLGSRHLAGIQGTGVLGGGGFGWVPEELDSERARKARVSVEAEFRMYRSPVAPGAGVQGDHWICGVTAERAWEVEGRRVGPGRGRPYGSQ